MHYIIQENVFRDQHYNLVISALERLQLTYEIVSLNDTDSFEFKSKRKDVFCFGSIKLARIAKKNAWHPGSLMNENHDYSVYAEYWQEHMLNWDSKIQDLKTAIAFGGGRKFIRPTQDSKIFGGQLFDAQEWELNSQDSFRKRFF